jgi:hypothetical protein
MKRGLRNEIIVEYFFALEEIHLLGIGNFQPWHQLAVSDRHTLQLSLNHFQQFRWAFYKYTVSVVSEVLHTSRG